MKQLMRFEFAKCLLIASRSRRIGHRPTPFKVQTVHAVDHLKLGHASEVVGAKISQLLRLQRLEHLGSAVPLVAGLYR